MIFMGRDGIFAYFQSLNAVYFIPLLGMILIGMFHKTADGKSAIISIVTGLVIMLWGTFPGSATVEKVFGSGFHFMGVVFVFLIALQLVLTKMGMRRETPYVQQDAKAVDLTPWKPAPVVGGVMIVTVLAIYLALAR